ncbi:MAG TPA: efflux RND transporter permease subunit [Terriglobia bacterium]|nr:efflux RND transporter permease subunit [Terriglobia bacterium]
MSRFAIRNPYFIIVLCLFVVVIGLTSLVRMPVDLFPVINIPEVVVATFYSGMPPEEMEGSITGRFERFFTLGAGIDHMESRSLEGVSIIKIFFQPGTNADSDATEISNLAMADLGRLPKGTLPPVVMKFDASSLPVCLVTLKGQGLSEAQLRDTGQYAVRDQLATARGASVPPPFGGKYRQIMVYVDPLKLQAHGLSVMDVVDAINKNNLILPAGDAKIGPYDYDIYTNSEIEHVPDLNKVPLKTVQNRYVTVADVGSAKDASTIQLGIVRVGGQRSVYLPIMKQGGDTNTIAVVDAVKSTLQRLVDVPKQLVTNVVFDQSEFVKKAINTLIHEGATGLLLTGLMVLLFLGSLRGTAAVFLSIPLSALAAIIALYFGGSTINSMMLAGLAIVFSRLIDNSVIVLENIFRHMELGEPPPVAAEKGGQEVSLAVLAATIASAVVFFPVTFLYGVGRFLFSALAVAVVLALFASYFIAMTVVPLFCAKLIKGVQHGAGQEGRSEDTSGHAGKARPSWGARFNAAFNKRFHQMLDWYEAKVDQHLLRPWVVVSGILGVFLVSLLILPLLGVAFFPRSDAGQFVISMKAPSGTRVELTEKLVAKVEDIVHQVVGPHDLKLIVSNLGVVPDFTSIYTANSGPHTATIQVALNDDHKIGSYEYMDRVRKQLAAEVPEVDTFFQSGSLQDAVLNQGLPAPIDLQVSGQDLHSTYRVAADLARRIRNLRGVSEAYIPQDIDYPALQLQVDRVRAGELGLSQQEVVNNVITALTSNQMIAPSYWIDPRTGNDYFLTVQYPESDINSLFSLKGIPIRSPSSKEPAFLDQAVKVSNFKAPTEVDHYQIQRVIDVYVSPTTEDLGRVANAVDKVTARTHLPEGVGLVMRGMVEGMRQSFRSFGFGLILALALLYLVLVAQFRSFVDPFLILLAVPTGLTGVLLLLWLTGTTVNVVSLMGVVMMVGIVTSNSILIVEFAHHLEAEMSVRDAVVTSCRIRLRPILMTSLATIFGLIPMALKLETGSEAYASLGRAIIGGLVVSVALTVFIVPAAYLLVYRNKKGHSEPPAQPLEAQ